MYNDSKTLSPTLKDSYADEDKKRKKKARMDALRKYADGGTSKDKMKCNKPVRESKGKHTHKVKACQDGKEKLVRFGHKMPDGTKNPERKKSYCARSKGIGNTKNKLGKNFWSRKNWNC